MRPIARLLTLACFPLLLAAQSTPPDVAPAINALGLDLYRQQIKSASGQSVLLSPYSISTALAMTYAGADGATKTEMQRVLHFPADAAACSEGFRLLQSQLHDLMLRAGKDVAELRAEGGEATPLTLQAANRLYVQKGFKLQPDFLRLMSKEFGASVGETDFRSHPESARSQINQWVAEFTHDRIPDLLPVGQPQASSRLVLVNALYLKAAWRDAFRESNTEPQPFHLTPRDTAPVPTMLQQEHFGYDRRDGYSVVTLPYQPGGLQFVLFVPDAIDGLAALEQQLTAADLAACAQLSKRDVILYLPKFKLAPGTMPLGEALQNLGLQTAFDLPRGSANFARMAPRQPDDYLAIGQVFHQTWLSLDEHGTEAAAATAVVMLSGFVVAPPNEPPPIEVRADRPFLFAIQHIGSGACLFLGRVTDPRSE
jgi:serpin B